MGVFLNDDYLNRPPIPHSPHLQVDLTLYPHFRLKQPNLQLVLQGCNLSVQVQ